MKRIVFLMLCIFSYVVAMGQHANQHYVYGVDYTHAKAFAVSDSPEQLAEAFQAINSLLLTEGKKYDFSRMLGVRYSLDIEPTQKLNAASNYPGLIVYKEEMPELDCAEIVRGYELSQTEGTGVVFIAKMLNKARAETTFEVVIFDVATREISVQQEVTAKAGGFGLRNYWAKSLFNVLRSTNFSKR